MLKKANFKKLLCGYKIYFMLYVLFAFNGFVNGLAFMQIATGVAAVAGAVLILWMLIQYKLYWKTKNLFILLALIASAVLSSILNYRYGVIENIQSTIWMVLQMGLLYTASSNYEVEEVKKEFKLLAVIYIAYCTIANIISISMVYWGRGLDYKDPAGVVHALGFRWGRLWGIYDDPNHGATIAVAAIFFALYLHGISKKKCYKVLLLVSIAIQFVYMVFSDSRTGLVCLLIGAFIWTFIKCLVYFHSNKLSASHIKAGVAASLFVLLVFGADYGGKELYNELDKKVMEFAGKNRKLHNVNLEKTLIGRKNDVAGDSSNGRTAIWKSGLEIFKESPIYGVSFRNMTEYAQENIPDTYLVNNAHQVKYDSMHNMPIDIVVSQGIIGGMLLLALVINSLIYWKKNLGRIEKKHYAIIVGLFSTIVLLSGGSLFITMIFYLNSPQTFCFWICFGYLMAIFRQTSGKETKLA